MKRRVILLGPPGSGKGTLAGWLGGKFGFEHFSTGHLLRAEVARGSAVGRRAGEYLERGELVPDDLVLGLVEGLLGRAGAGAGYLSDGFPRTLAQAVAFDGWSGARGLGIECVIYCECSEGVVLGRIAGRRTCGGCRRVYHVRWLPPAAAGVCDGCGGGLVQRSDDGEAVVRRRFELYVRETEPLVEYYRGRGLLGVVDGGGPVEDMLAGALAELRK